jgi:hypothetical protein
MAVYVALIQAPLRRNLVYTWAHMANNVHHDKIVGTANQPVNASVNSSRSAITES